MKVNKVDGLGGFIIAGFCLFVGVAMVFVVLEWLQIPAGRLIDWIVGAAGFWWLLVVTTVPWNICFQAREVRAQAAESIRAGIKIETEHIGYINRIAWRALAAAILLHVLTAAIFYVLAVRGITPVGYTASVLALLLTGLRPAVRGYEYLLARLAMIRHGLLYPREDVFELRNRMMAIEERVENLAEIIDLSDADSALAQHARALKTLRENLAYLAAQHDERQATNKLEHEQLARDAERLVSRISTDGQVLDHVRELVRFFKTA